MKRSKSAICIATTIFIVCCAFAAHAEVYKIGLSLAITGPTSDAGNPYSKGVEDYFNYVNETNLLGKDRIESMIRDDQYLTDITKRNFEEFLDAGMEFFLSYSTGSTLALKRDFDEEKIPVIPASMDAGNLVDSTYTFLPTTSYSDQTIAVAEYVFNHHKEGVPKVAMFIHPSAFGRAPVQDLQKAMAAGLKLEIVEIVEHGLDLDNTAMLQRLLSKKVQYVLCQTVQSPVATLIKDAERLGVIAKTFGEKGKLTFLGAHYTGGNDLFLLAGTAAENFYWATSYRLTSEPGEGTTFVLNLAKRYNRDNKIANSHNYTAGITVAQIATELIKRTKARGKAIKRNNLYAEMLVMNGADAFDPKTTVGPVNFSKTDRKGVDDVQIYAVKDGVLASVGKPFIPEYVTKIK